MKNLLVIAFLSVLVLFLGCKNQNDTNPNAKLEQLGLPVGEPIDYFPKTPGTLLNYEITVGDMEPIFHKTMYWPKGDQVNVSEMRGRFSSVMINTNKKTFILQLRIKGSAAQQGQLNYPVGIELSVEKDELGLYNFYKQLFWSATSGNDFVCQEVVTYPPNSPGSLSNGSWGEWNAEDGYSMRIIFFGNKPGIEMNLSNEKDDKILFNGIKRVPESNEYGLNFTRTVDSRDYSLGDDVFNKGFIEESYFVKDRGLVYLRQIIDGKTSMTWRRVDNLGQRI